MFTIGDKVTKKVGDYQTEWVVVGIFKTVAGNERMACESLVIPGLIHIFNSNQLSK